MHIVLLLVFLVILFFVYLYLDDKAYKARMDELDMSSREEFEKYSKINGLIEVIVSSKEIIANKALDKLLRYGDIVNDRRLEEIIRRSSSLKVQKRVWKELERRNTPNEDY